MTKNMARKGPGFFKSGQRSNFAPDSSRGGYGLEGGPDHDWQTDPSNSIPGPYNVMPAGPSHSGPSVPSIPYRPGVGFPPEPDSSFFDRHLFPPAMNSEDPWAYQPQRRLTDDFPYDATAGGGWTITCNVDPGNQPTEFQRKTGINPGAIIGAPNVGSTCNVSAVSRANCSAGTNVPAGATLVQMVQSGIAWPNANGRPYWVATHPASPAAKPFPYKVGTRALPINAPFAHTQMAPQPTTYARTRYHVPYGTPAMTVVLQDGKPPEKDPDDVHLHVPPGPGEREDKPFDTTGRPVKQVWGALTEIDDALDCMEKSFKKNADPAHLKHVPINHRLDLRIYRLIREANGGNIDWQKFVNCMAVNNFTDALVGGIGGTAVRRLNRNPYRPKGSVHRGYGVGGGSVRMR